MAVVVRLFASLAEAAGCDSLSIELSAPISAGQLRDRVLSHCGVMAARNAIRVAVDESFVTDSSLVHDGDNVALIPPVAGG